MQELRDAGFLPEAVRNYLALLGWGAADDQTILSTQELVAQFDVARVQKNPAQFDVKKLTWLNGRYVREMSVDELTARLEAFTGRTGLREAVAISQEKIGTLRGLLAAGGLPLRRARPTTRKAREKWLDADHRHALVQAREALAHLEPFDVERIEVALREVVEADPERKPKDVFQPIRVALAGTTISPGIFESLAVLGRDESLRRLDAALATSTAPDAGRRRADTTATTHRTSVRSRAQSSVHGCR